MQYLAIRLYRANQMYIATYSSQIAIHRIKNISETK